MLMVPSARGFVGRPGFLHPYPYFIGATQPVVYTTKRTNLSLAVPTGAQVGDFLLAWIYNGSYFYQPTVPTGWTLLQSMGTSWLFYSIWNGIANPNFSWAQYGAMSCTGAMFAYRNVDPTYLWDYDPTSGVVGFSATEGVASSVGSAMYISQLYATGPNRTFVNAFFSVTPDTPQYLGYAYQPDSFTQSYVGIYMNAQPATQTVLSRTDNASYYACCGVADLSPCDTVSGATLNRAISGLTPNCYLGDTVSLGNYSAPTTSTYSDEDMVVMGLMLVPVGATVPPGSPGPAG